MTRNLSDRVEDDVKLSDLSKEKHGVTADQLRAGLSKAFKASKPKGFMAKLGGFLSKAKLPKIPGAEDVEDMPVEKLGDELLSLTFGQLKKVGETAEDSADVAQDSSVPSDAVKDITSPDAEVSQENPESEGEEKTEEKAEEKAEEKDEEAQSPEEESSPDEEIQATLSAASSTPMTPKDAISKALDDWEASMSASSRKSLQAKKRNQALKDAVFSGIDKGKKAVQSAVTKAVKKWRAEHEETLLKSKRFAKKNFDSLESMIPQLAAQVLSQANENNQKKISIKQIDKFVHRKLNQKYFPAGVLYEKWQKNAGLLKD